MTHIKITKFDLDEVCGVLTTENNEFSVPLRVAGLGLHRFRQQGSQKSISINPDIVNITRNYSQIYSIKEIKLVKMFGRSLLEGVRTECGRTAALIDLKQIKQIWTDSCGLVPDVWNIEV